MREPPPSGQHHAIDTESPSPRARFAPRCIRDPPSPQDALVAALERWPESGIPDNPGAWLMATAKNRAIDELRRGQRIERKHDELGHEIEARRGQVVADLDAAIDDDVGDDLLRLVFTACHPLLSTDARVALTLRLLGGLTTEEIARAYLVPEPTIAQRIVRAKRALAEARVPFEVPRGADRAARLSSRRPAETDWARIVALYEGLARLAPSPVVELNRAVAVAMAFGPAAVLALVDALTAEPSLEGYHLLPSVRGDLLARLGRFDEARAELERAASLTRNGRERKLLRERAAECARGKTG